MNKRQAIRPDSAMTLSLKKQQAERDIQELSGHLANPRMLIYRRSVIMGKLAESYQILGDKDMMCATCWEIIDMIKLRKKELTGIDPKRLSGVNYWFHHAHVMLAPYSFQCFLTCMEWNYPPSMKFYANRICVLQDWAHKLQQLEAGDLDILGLSAPPRSGKEQPLSSHILTPTGWTTMGDLFVGQKVIGADGRACTVLGIIPQGVKDVYRVTFDDDTYAECGINHLWEVQTHDDRCRNHYRVVSTEELMKHLYVECGKRKNYTVRYVKPVEFNSELTPSDLSPYVLGALLGDGHFRKHSVGFTSADDDILSRISKLLPKTDMIVHCKPGKFNKYDYSIIKEDNSVRNSHGYMIPTETMRLIESYGLSECRSEDKFIPNKYLYASVGERIELLRGLMDTDGYAGESGNTYNEFCTVSKQLKNDIVELIRSLGGRVAVNEKQGSYRNADGKKVICQKVYRIAFNMEINPFFCERKRKSFVPRSVRNHKYITKIEKVRQEECQCIYVDSPDHLYVTDGYNLTHNTGIGELFLAWIIGRHPDKSTLFATHTNGMAIKAQTDVYNLITDPRRGWSEIFPGFTIEKSVEYLWMDLSPKENPNTYKTIYFRGIDGSFAGILEASWLIYCDDLINGIVEATNPDRLNNAWQKYGTDISQRRVDDNVKELHIATRWSTKDVLSRLEEENEGNPRAEFIKVPGLDEKGESNFLFPYRPMTKEHFEKLRDHMDEVSFECIVQQNPIEREGLLFPESSLKLYDKLPDGTPDRVCFACDVAWGGGDYLSMPIGKVYGMDVYIDDVVHSPADKYTTKPLVVGAIIRSGATAGFFEFNNGGDEYMDDIVKEIRKRGYRCAIKGNRAPSNKSKLDRIIATAPEIKGSILDGSGYRLHFKSKALRHGDKAYMMFMKHLTEFNEGARFQGKQKDDAADATASLVTNELSHASSGSMTSLPRSALF